MTTLTNTAINAMRQGAELKDGFIPGLSIRCHASGHSWMLYYRPKIARESKARRLKIGSFPTITIARAREIARDLLTQVAAGRDPKFERNRSADAPDIDALWKICEHAVWNTGKAWSKEAKRIYRANIGPKIGRVKVGQLAYAQVKALHNAMWETPIQANRVLAVLSRMIKEAERLELRDRGTNPCGLVKHYAARQRKRFATAEELAKLGPVLDAFAQDPKHVSGVAFLYILLFSGARPSEVENGTPEMLERVDGGAGVLRFPDGKTGPRDVYLPAQAMAVIDRLPAQRERLAGRAHMPRRLWALIRKKVGAPDLWARDMRRTFATAALSGGTPIGIVGELLGHKSAATTKIYAKLFEEHAHAAAASTATAVQKMLEKKDETDRDPDERVAAE